ncbi:DGQHR domain-containing protein [Luteibacter sp. HA06]
MNKGLAIRALRTHQAGVPVYAFFVPGSRILELASISRLEKGAEGLDGFQRPPVQKHIASMVEYLEKKDVLFPNAILLAMSPRVRFKKSRGPVPPDLAGDGEAGWLEFPATSGERRLAWVVDGQQRSMALERAAASELSVPVIAFASDDLQLHREQFVLVNKAKPLSRRFVDELLPEIDASRLPPDMAPRRIPSALVTRLDEDVSSPFLGMIKRSTSPREPDRVVNDGPLTRAIMRQINQPLGALASFRSLDGDSTDPNGMFECLVGYWAQVKRVFPEAWGLPPERSRLMHSAGIEAMSALMDYLYPRLSGTNNVGDSVAEALRSIAPHCAWTNGRWPDLGCAWNEVEHTTKFVRRLTEQLVRLAKSHLSSDFS